MHNITASKIATFKWTKLKPAIDMMIKAKVSPDELNKYMLAKFAPYRNEEVNRLYPNNFDPDGRPFLKDEGSGMKTSEANRYLNSLSPDRKALLESLARPWYKIIDDTLNVAEQSGDIPADAASQLRQQNDKLNQLGQNYVPTQRQFSEAELNSIPLGRSGGINLTGMFGKGFMGSTRAVDSIIKNISNQHIRAIDRGEQNKVGNALFAAVLQYPNPDFWTAVFPDAIKDPQAFIQMLNRLGYDVETYENLAEEPKERYIKHLNPRSAAEDDLLRDANGFSVPAPKKVVAAKANIMRRFGPTVISTKFNGRQAYIFFNRNNPMAVEMAKSLKNLDAPKVGMLLRANRSYNSFLGMVNTTLDPAFAVRTLIQHYPFAMANLGATELGKYIPQITADLVPAMAGVLSAVFREEAAKNTDPRVLKTWTNWARQAMDNGVVLHDRSHMYGDPRQRDITQQVYNKLKTNAAKKTFRTAFESMSKLALVFENAINVATYKAGIDAGLGPQKSAMIALQVMGNLSRKGKYTPITNTLYLFSGVSFNATETFAKTMKNLNKVGSGVVAAYFTIGALQPLLLQSYGIDPADIPEETKQKYFMFPHDDGTITKIGTGWVFRMIPNTGRIAMEYAMEGDNLGKYSTNWLSMMADAATPVGGHFGWRAAVPTTLQMPLSLAINKTPQGTPVSKEERSNKPTTGLSRTSPKAGEISRWVAENMNSMTGGDKYKPGAFSPTGDAIEYFFYEGIFGGPGRLEKQISAYSAGEVGGKPVDISQTPVIGAFEMDTNAPSFVSQKFYDNVKEMYLHEEEIKGLKKSGQPVESYFKEHPEARLWNQAEAVLSAINQENAKRNKIMAKELPIEQRDKRLSVIEARKTRIMENFNERVKRLKKKE